MLTAIVVWLLVGYSHGGWLTYGPEFQSEKRCEAAISMIQEKMTQNYLWGIVPPRAKCVRIEK